MNHLKSDPQQAKEWFKKFFCSEAGGVSEPYVLIVCGSRFATLSSKVAGHKKAAEQVMDLLEYIARMFTPFCVVQGHEAKPVGVDFLSQMIFEAADVPVSPINRRLKNTNQKILETAKVVAEASDSKLLCLAAPGKESYDAMELAKMCLQNEIPVFEMNLKV